MMNEKRFSRWIPPYMSLTLLFVLCGLAILRCWHQSFLWEVPYEEAAYSFVYSMGDPASAEPWSPHPPGYVWFLRSVATLSSDPPTAQELRISSSCFFIAATFLIYFLVRSVSLSRNLLASARFFLASPAGLLAACTFATNPRVLSHARALRPESLTSVLLIAFLLTTLIWIRFRTRWILLAATGFSVMLVLTNIYGLFYVASWSVGLVCCWDRRKGFFFSAVFSSIPLIVSTLACLLYPSYGRHLDIISDHYWNIINEEKYWQRWLGLYGSILIESFPVLLSFPVPTWIVGLLVPFSFLGVWLGQYDLLSRSLLSCVFVMGVLLFVAHEFAGVSVVSDYLEGLIILNILAFVAIASRTSTSLFFVFLLLVPGGLIGSLSEIAPRGNSDNSFQEVVSEVIKYRQPDNLPIIIAGSRLYVPLREYLPAEITTQSKCYFRGGTLKDRWCGAALISPQSCVDQDHSELLLPHHRFVLVSMEGSGAVYPFFCSRHLHRRSRIVHPSFTVGCITIEVIEQTPDSFFIFE